MMVHNSKDVRTVVFLNQRNMDSIEIRNGGYFFPTDDVISGSKKFIFNHFYMGSPFGRASGGSWGTFHGMPTRTAHIRVLPIGRGFSEATGAFLHRSGSSIVGIPGFALISASGRSAKENVFRNTPNFIGCKKEGVECFVKDPVGMYLATR